MHACPWVVELRPGTSSQEHQAVCVVRSPEVGGVNGPKLCAQTYVLNSDIIRPQSALLLISSQIPLAQTKIPIICMWRTLFILSPSALRSCPPSFHKLAWEGNRNPCWKGKVIPSQSPPAPSSQSLCAEQRVSQVCWHPGKHCSLSGHCKVELGEGQEEGSVG